MSQRHSQQRTTRRNGQNQADGETATSPMRTQGSWNRGRRFQQDEYPPRTYLTRLIEEDAPLFSNSHLHLMYGPFQAVMPYESGLGVATWLRGCLQQHGLPSLVRLTNVSEHRFFAAINFNLGLML